MWKILNGKSPNDIQVQLRPPSRHGIQAVIPPMTRGCRQIYQTQYDSSFAVVGPKLWNSLPANLSIISTWDNFKNKLTNYMDSLPDEPPVSGYTRVHSNTLLEVTRLHENNGN